MKFFGLIIVPIIGIAFSTLAVLSGIEDHHSFILLGILLGAVNASILVRNIVNHY